MAAYEPVRISASAEAEIQIGEEVNVESQILLGRLKAVVETEIRQKRKERMVRKPYQEPFDDDIYTGREEE